MPIAVKDVPSPFKFLDAYNKQDGDIFFGRDTEIEQLYQSVNKNRIVLVYGQSGTGKTSLVQCGLSNRFGVTDWVPFWIRRGKDINEALRHTLAESKALGGANVTEKNLLSSLERLAKRYVRPVYLIFDQFEELLLLGDEAEKQLFLDTIKAILENEHTEACHLLFLIREEYFGWLESFESAIPGFSDRRLRVEPMRPDRLDEVINQSCAAFNIELEDPKENTRQIRQSLRTKSGIALPYLQVYLDLLYREDYQRTYPDGWEGTAHPPLRFETKEIMSMGAIDDLMERLLNDRRETIQKDLSKQHPEIGSDFVQKVLDGFVTFEGTKRPVTYERTAQGIELDEKAPASLQALPPAILGICLEALENNRLLRADEDTFELAHDSLAALIDRKRSDEQRRINEVYRQIRSSYQIFQDTKTDFLSRNQLALYENYLPHLELDHDLISFIEKSRQHLRSTEEADRQKLIEERQLRESAEKNANTAKIRTRVAVALAVIASIAAIWAGSLSIINKRAKEEIIAKSKEGRAAILAIKSRKRFYDNHNLAWQLAARAYEMAPTPETALTLRDMSSVIRPAEQIMSLHTFRIRDVRFSQDGQYLLSLGDDSTIRRTNIDSGEYTLISGDFGTITCSAFSKNGRFAILGTKAGPQLWDLQDKVQVSGLETVKEEVLAVAINSDGSKIALGITNKVNLYDVATGQLSEILNLENQITALAFVPDGNGLVTAGYRIPATLWTFEGSKQRDYPSPTGSYITKLAFSPDGQLLATGSSAGEVKKWRTDGTNSDVLQSNGRLITALKISDEGEILTGDSNGVLRYWSKSNYIPTEILLTGGNALEAVTFIPENEGFLAADWRGNLLAWSRAVRSDPAEANPNTISRLAYIDNSSFLTADEGGKIKIWRRDHAPEHLLREDGEIWAMDISPDKKFVATGNSFGEIYLVALDGGGERKIYDNKEGVQSLQYSPDGQHLLISAGETGIVQLLNLDGVVERTYGAGGVQRAFFSPDGQLIMTSGDDGTNSLYQADGTLLHTGFTHTRYDAGDKANIDEKLVACLYTSNSQRIITGGEDGFLRMWNHQGTEIDRINTLSGQIIAAAIAPNGEYIASSSTSSDRNYVINIWTLDGILVQAFYQKQPMQAIQFSPDGRYILAGGSEGMPKLIPLWNTILENNTVSLIDQHQYGLIGQDGNIDAFLASNEQIELAAYGRYFAFLYHNDGKIKNLQNAQKLYEKALSSTLQAQPNALSKEWWERDLSGFPGDTPILVNLRVMYVELLQLVEG